MEVAETLNIQLQNQIELFAEIEHYKDRCEHLETMQHHHHFTEPPAQVMHTIDVDVDVAKEQWQRDVQHWKMRVEELANKNMSLEQQLVVGHLFFIW